MKKLALFIIILFVNILLVSSIFAQKRYYKAPEFAKNWSKPGLHPDHIVLNLTEEPATSMSVSWRTNTSVPIGYAEIAIATAAPKFWRNAKTITARTETFDGTNVILAGTVSNYHSVTFQNLVPDTTYAYRVGDGQRWSEWFHFRTAAQTSKPFSFLYLGDAQNFILELWARLIREGYRKAPDARFIIHAGDLVTDAHSERQWHEWFTAGGFIHSVLPSIMTPGNHEFQPRTEKEAANDVESLSAQWRPQFALPENGIEGEEETVYYVDYQDTRIISLNSNQTQEEQVTWLDDVLKNNPKKWAIVTFHHPLFSASERRDNAEIRNLWKPILDKHKVDLVLQGHDHSYARGRAEPGGENVLAGLNKRDYTGTVYVVSVSGGKMYKLEPTRWDAFDSMEQDRSAENTQLFQVITIDGDKLSYEAYTAMGELYDAFDLMKSGDDKPNRFFERKGEAIPARRHDNTTPYEESLPAAVETKILKENEGFELHRVLYYDEIDLQGFYVRLYKENIRLDLKIDMEGNVLERKTRQY